MHIKMTLINARNSAHDFSVKLSPCMCSSGWRNDCNLLAHVIPSYRGYLPNTYASSIIPRTKYNNRKHCAAKILMGLWGGGGC